MQREATQLPRRRFDCDAVVRGESVDEVMAQAGPHAKEAHDVDVTPEMAGRLRTLVHDA